MGYEKLFEEPMTSKLVYRGVRKVFQTSFYLSLFISLLLLSWDFSNNDIISDFSLWTLSFFCLEQSIILMAMSMTYILSLSANDIVTIHNITEDISGHKISRTFKYIRAFTNKNWRMFMYPSLAVLFASIFIVLTKLYEVGIVGSSFTTFLLLVVYVTTIYPLRFTFARYRGMFLAELVEAGTSIQISCSLINEEIRNFYSNSKPLNMNAVEVNVTNIRDGSRELSQITDYFSENMNPPTIVEFMRFIVPATASVLISEVIPFVFG